MADFTRNFLTQGPPGGTGGGGVSGDDITTGRAYRVVFREITSAIDDATNKNDSHSKEIVDQLKALRAQLKADAEKYSRTRLGDTPPEVYREFVDVLKTVKGILERDRGQAPSTTGPTPATGVHREAHRVHHHRQGHRTDDPWHDEDRRRGLGEQAFRGGGPVGVAAMAGADAVVPGLGIVVKAIQENSNTIRDTYRVIVNLPKEIGDGYKAVRGVVKGIHDFLNPRHPLGVISHLEKMAVGGAALGLGALGLTELGVFGPEAKKKLEEMFEKGLSGLDEALGDAAKKGREELENKLNEILNPKPTKPDGTPVDTPSWPEVFKNKEWWKQGLPQLNPNLLGDSPNPPGGKVQDLNKRLDQIHGRTDSFNDRFTFGNTPAPASPVYSPKELNQLKDQWRNKRQGILGSRRPASARPGTASATQSSPAEIMLASPLSLRTPGGFTGDDQGSGDPVSSNQRFGLGYLGGGSGALSDIVPFAKGGIVDRPTIGLLGEAGPEAVVPLSGNGFNTGFNTGGDKGDVVVGLMKKQTDLLGGILEALTGGGGRTRGLGGGIQLASLSTGGGLTGGGVGLGGSGFPGGQGGFPGSGFGAGNPLESPPYSLPGGRLPGGGFGPGSLGGGFGGRGGGSGPGGGGGRRSGGGGRRSSSSSSPGGTPDVPATVNPLDISPGNSITPGGSRDWSTGDPGGPPGTTPEYTPGDAQGGGPPAGSGLTAQTTPDVAGRRNDIPYDPKTKISAAERYNSPGAGEHYGRSYLFGATGKGIIGGGHSIDRYPNTTQGLAAAMDLFSTSSHYQGKTLEQAIATWRDKPVGSTPLPPGFTGKEIVDANFANDKTKMATVFRSFYGHETGKGGGVRLSNEQINTAFDIKNAGGMDNYFKQNPGAVAQRGVTPGQPNPTSNPGGALRYDPVSATGMGQGLGGSSLKFGSGKHQGVDIFAPKGSPVYADRDGVIERIGKDDFGTAVTIRHADGTTARYLHLLPDIDAKVGAQIKAGQSFAKSGVGNRIPHLHYELWSGTPGKSQVLDPNKIMQWNEKNLPVGGQVGRAFQGQQAQAPGVVKASQGGGMTIAFRGIKGRLGEGGEEALKQIDPNVKIFNEDQWKEAAAFVKANPNTPYKVIGFSQGASGNTLNPFLKEVGSQLPTTVHTVGQSANAIPVNIPPGVTHNNVVDHDLRVLARQQATTTATRGIQPPNAADARITSPGVISPVTGTFGGHPDSGYGASRSEGSRRHSGVDMQAKDGSAAVAMTGGTVIYKGHNQGYQWNMVIKGDDGIIRRYATHGPLENIGVGQRVQQGQKIGTIARGHLHYEEIHSTDANGKPNPVYTEFERNARANTFTSTTQQRGVTSPVTGLGIQLGTPLTSGKPIGPQPTTVVAGNQPTPDTATPGATRPPIIPGSLEDIETRRQEAEAASGGRTSTRSLTPVTSDQATRSLTTTPDWTPGPGFEDVGAGGRRQSYESETSPAKVRRQADDSGAGKPYIGIRNPRHELREQSETSPVKARPLREQSETSPIRADTSAGSQDLAGPDYPGHPVQAKQDTTDSPVDANPIGASPAKADTRDKPQHTPKHHQRHPSKTSRRVASHTHQPHNVQSHNHNKHHAIRHPGNRNRHTSSRHTNQPNHHTIHQHPTHHSRHPHHSQPHHVRHPNRGHAPMHHDDMNIGNHPTATAMREDIGRLQRLASDMHQRPEPDRGSGRQASSNMHHGTPEVSAMNSDIAAVMASGTYNV